jgi:hypothetical protein
MVHLVFSFGLAGAHMQHDEFYVTLWPYIILNSETKKPAKSYYLCSKIYVVLVSTEEKER